MDVLGANNRAAPNNPNSHPLLNNSVVGTLFSYLDVDNLKECRHVCSLWNIEAFRVLRKRTEVILDTECKIQEIIQSGVAGSFGLFPLTLCTWNERVADLVDLMQPSSIQVEVDVGSKHAQRVWRMRLGGFSGTQACEDVPLQTFLQLLLKHSKILIGLKVNLYQTTGFTTPPTMLDLQFPKLKRFSIVNKHAVKVPDEVFMSIYCNSPALECFELTNLSIYQNLLAQSSTFENLKELQCVTKSSVIDAIETVSTLNGNLPPALYRLCIPFHFDIPGEDITRVLQQVSRTLEVLEFYTQNETPLSPIEFPVMPKLRILDSGSSQFSFPTIVTSTFPQLSEIRATFWDWVYTNEEVPDSNYFWRTSHPHQGVTEILIRFPDWPNTHINVKKLENFEEFSQVVLGKFPSITSLSFRNVPLVDEVRQGLEKFVQVHEFSMKTLRIASYFDGSKRMMSSVCPFELNANSTEYTPTRGRVLEELDLCPKDWLRVARKHKIDWMSIRDEWIPSLLDYNQLTTLKLLWGKDLLSKLNLTNLNNLPNLEYLEFIGDRCVNRFERAAVRASRTSLRIRQLQNCDCNEEDMWYMHDPNSNEIFRKLFSSKRPLTRLFAELQIPVYSDDSFI